MPFGVVIDAPNEIASYGRVRDEHGGEYTVHGAEFSPDAEPDDDFAYHVDLWQYRDRNVTTLRSGTYGPEGK